jgi:phosphate starvation-inducible protein PhoH
VEAAQVLKGIDGISFIHFNDRDVVRHRLVREIIKAYDNLEADALPAQAESEWKVRIMAVKRKRRSAFSF